MQGLSKSIPLYRFRRHHNRRCVYDMKFCGFCKIVWIVALQIQQDLNHKELTERTVSLLLYFQHIQSLMMVTVWTWCTGKNLNGRFQLFDEIGEFAEWFACGFWLREWENENRIDISFLEIRENEIDGWVPPVAWFTEK